MRIPLKLLQACVFNNTRTLSSVIRRPLPGLELRASNLESSLLGPVLKRVSAFREASRAQVSLFDILIDRGTICCAIAIKLHAIRLAVTISVIHCVPSRLKEILDFLLRLAGQLTFDLGPLGVIDIRGEKGALPLIPNPVDLL